MAQYDEVDAVDWDRLGHAERMALLKSVAEKTTACPRCKGKGTMVLRGEGQTMFVGCTAFSDPDVKCKEKIVLYGLAREMYLDEEDMELLKVKGYVDKRWHSAVLHIVNKDFNNNKEEEN